ncbi:S8 family serine peptidase [Actinomadura decatromicini]|nr:S8 family serine peptidase [Actinomadura decatromicini]
MAAASALVLSTAMPAVATPRGRDDQWWFSAWAIEKETWPISKGAGVTVAVIDNGVNGRIPDLQGVLVPGIDQTTFKGGDGQIAPTSDVDGSHGTAMAGLIASRGTGTGYVGVAPEAKIMSVKSSLTVWDKGIRFAVDHGAKVISISQGFATQRGCGPELQQAVSYALQRDVVVVASAGNDGDESNDSEEPGDCIGVLTVGAVDNKKTPWVSTQRKPYVSVAAPGVGVNALRADGTLLDNVSGTSQAAALTAAVVTLVRSKYPQMSAREVVQRIINTAVDAGPRGKDDLTGYGVVIPHAALTATVPKSAPNPVFAAYDRWMRSNPVQPSAVPSVRQPKTAAEKDSDQAARNTQLLIVGLVVAGLLGAVFVVFLVVRGRRRAGGVASVGGPQQYGPPPGWGGAAGPPPPPPPNGPGGTRPPN